MKLVPIEDRENASFRQGGGCAECHETGFSGRISVCELMTVNQPLREAVIDKLPTRTLQEVAVDHGMKTMWTRGLRRALDGQTTLEEILRVISVDEI
jgi:type II secretory ATPase GspE/PulE/Tfp pilus assembly ATPase PilB-like protein